MPIPAADEIISYLAVPDSAVAKLISDAVAQVVINAARDQFDEVIESFGDDDSKEVSVNMLDYDKLSLEYIASIPPTQRGSSALTEDDWNNFFADYLAVMVQATGKEETRIKHHIELFKRPQKAKANKEVMAVLLDQLEIYNAASANLEETGACVERISNKFTKWMTEPDAAANVDLL
jgi:hypothetical protein